MLHRIVKIYFITLSIIFILSQSTLFSNISPDYNSKALTIIEHSTDIDFLDGQFHNVEIINSGEDAALQLYSGLWEEQHPVSNIDIQYDFDISSFYGSNKVILFTWDGNTWIYDLDTNRWDQVFPDNSPPPRRAFGMTSIYGTDCVLIFSGFNMSSMYYYEDTWYYDLSENNWTKIISGNSPEPRRNHAMTCIYNSKDVLLYGGDYFKSGESSKVFDDTWIFNWDSKSWTNQYPNSNPRQRTATGMASIYNTDKVVVFSGMDYSNYQKYKDTWIYDFSENNWTRMAPATNPPKRWHHQMEMIYGTNEVLLFGGFDDNYDNETWLYNYKNDIWIKRDPPVIPISRDGHSMTAINNTDSRLLVLL